MTQKESILLRENNQMLKQIIEYLKNSPANQFLIDFVANKMANNSY